MASSFTQKVLEMLVSGFNAGEIAKRLNSREDYIRRIITMNGWTSPEAIRRAEAELLTSEQASAGLTPGNIANLIDHVDPADRDALLWNAGTGQYENRAITEADISDLQNYSLVGHTHAAADIVSGQLADARISESSVTQHEAALSLSAGQINDNNLLQGESPIFGGITVNGNTLFDIGTNEFRIQNGAAIFVADGATGQIALGNETVDDVGLLLDTPSRAVTASLDYDRLKVASTGPVTVPGSTTSTHVVTAQFDEPNINLAPGAVVTQAITVYIPGAPTEGNENYSLFVESGLSRFSSGQFDGIVTFKEQVTMDHQDTDGTLNITSGNGSISNTYPQIAFGYAGSKVRRHAIYSRHNAGGQPDNALDFFLWDPTVDASGDIGTFKALTLDQEESRIFSPFRSPSLALGTTLVSGNVLTVGGKSNFTDEALFSGAFGVGEISSYNPIATFSGGNATSVVIKKTSGVAGTIIRFLDGSNASWGTFIGRNLDHAGSGILTIETFDGIGILSSSVTPGSALTVGGTIDVSGNEVWHAGNDGPSSGLNADLLDGNHASAFALSGHTHTTSDITDNDLGTTGNPSFDSVNAQHPRETINIDTYQGDNYWFTEVATSASHGTTPENYAVYVNFGGSGSGQGLQLAASYGSNAQFYIRRRSDNASAPNGPNVWQPWREIWHDGNVVGGTDISVSGQTINFTGNYVPDTGGTFTGNVTIHTGEPFLYIDNSNETVGGIRFRDAQDLAGQYFQISYNSGSNQFSMGHDGDVNRYIFGSNLVINGNGVWHAGNLTNNETEWNTAYDRSVSNFTVNTGTAGQFTISRQVSSPLTIRLASLYVGDARETSSFLNSDTSGSYLPNPNDGQLNEGVTPIFTTNWSGPSWSGSLIVKGWTADYGAWIIQGPAGTSANVADEWWLRKGNGASWDTAVEIIHSGNYSSYVDKAYVDGLGVNADTVDGQHASAFATAGHTHTTSDITDNNLGQGDTATFLEVIANNNMVIGNASSPRITSGDDYLEFAGVTSSAFFGVQDGNGRIQLKWNATEGTSETYLESSEPAFFWDMSISSSPIWEMKYAAAGTAGNAITWTTLLSLTSGGTLEASNGMQVNGNTVWHAGNDGASSGLDADLLDGNHASAFATAGHTHALGDLSNVSASGEGAGGGFDADTVDGLHASEIGGGGPKVKVVGNFETLTNNSSTLISWSSEAYDSDGMHDNATNPSRLTVPTGEGGLYIISIFIKPIGLSFNNNEKIQITVSLNGSSDYIMEVDNYSPTSSGASLTGNITGQFQLSAGDYLEVVVYQNSGGDRSLDDDSFFAMAKIMD